MFNGDHHGHIDENEESYSQREVRHFILLSRFSISFSVPMFLSLLNIPSHLIIPLHTLEFFFDHLLFELIVNAI